MKEISILEIILVTILLVMPILSAYLAWRVFRLKKSVELLRLDRNKLVEEGIEMDEVNKGKFVLSIPEKKMMLAALDMPEHGKAIADPRTSFQTRKVYRDLREKIWESLKD